MSELRLPEMDAPPIARGFQEDIQLRQWCHAYAREAVLLERERCAKVCQTGREAFMDSSDIHDEFEWLAAAIRKG